MSKTPGQLLYEANADPSMNAWRCLPTGQQAAWDQKAKTLVREDWREDGDRLASAEITARDAFAMAVIGHLAGSPDRLEYGIDDDAELAYDVADAMLRARLTRP